MTGRTMIRHMTEIDIPDCVAMGMRFLASPDYASVVVGDAGKLTTLARTWLDNPDVAVWVAERDGALVGLFVMLMFDHAMSTDRVAVEVAWWVEPTARRVGIALLRVAEQWAKDRGATVLNMVAPNTRVGAFYEKTGFTLVERSYQRRL